MDKMFNKIVAFFQNAQKIKDERFKAFDEFHTMCVKSFPLGLRKDLAKCHIKPVNNNKCTYTLGFDAKDVLWWRGRYETENFLLKPIEEIKQDVMKCCLDIIDNMPLGELDEQTKALYDSILNDTL